jgi:hypothetical protein
MRKTICAVLLLVVALPVLAQQSERSIGSIYDGLSALSCGERRLAYHGYSREQQLELWTLHLQKFLAAHPKLTGPQRTLVLEGLDMISSGALDRIHDPRTTSLVQDFKQRALRQFDQKTFEDAFVILGGRRNPVVNARHVERVGTLQPYCNCDSEEDCGGGNCNYFKPCSEIIACGPFGMDWCLGVCD